MSEKRVNLFFYGALSGCDQGTTALAEPTKNTYLVNNVKMIDFNVTNLLARWSSEDYNVIKVSC
jgi:hypothetical protein